MNNFFFLKYKNDCLYQKTQVMEDTYFEQLDQESLDWDSESLNEERKNAFTFLQRSWKEWNV